MYRRLLKSDGLRQTWHILYKYPEARDCNRTLFKLFYDKFYSRHNNLDRPCPTQAQVSRWAHKVQTEIDRSLRPSSEAIERRRKASKGYFAKGAV